MANDLTTMEAFKNMKPSKAFDAVGPIESLAEGIGSSYGIIGYKGKNWQLRYKGTAHNVVRADDGTPAAHLDVIILRQARNKSKSFYDGGYDTNASEGKRPTCASLDGIVPDAEIVEPQSNACAICPRNQWKLDAKGKKTRECTDYKRLAVLVVPNQKTMPAMQIPIEPMFLRIPPASLNELSLYGEMLASQGFRYFAVVTRITFDPDQAHPKFMFRPLQEVDDASAAVVIPLITDSTSKRITGEDQVSSAPRQITSAPAKLAIAAPTPQPANSAPIVPTAQVITATPKPVDAPPAVVGLGLVAAASQPAAEQVTAPVTQTAADTGVPTQSDEELDALVKKMLTTPA